MRSSAREQDLRLRRASQDLRVTWFWSPERSASEGDVRDARTGPLQVRGDGVQVDLDVLQPLLVPAGHSSTASASTSRPTSGYVAGWHHIDLCFGELGEVVFGLARPSSPVPWARSTRRSTSRSGVSCLRAMLPSTGTLEAPCRVAIRLICCRCRRSRWPTGSVSRCLDRKVLQHRATTLRTRHDQPRHLLTRLRHPATI